MGRVLERFAGRVALVTGAGHGIGAATARRLHAEGAAVVLADVDLAAAEAVAAELDDGLDGGREDEREDSRATAVACDITDPTSVDAAVADAVRRHGRLDALVNVAGGARPHPGVVDGMTDDDWAGTVDLNLAGPMRVVRAAAPHLSRRGGAIVLVGSVNGLQAFGDEAYSAAKAGLSSLAQNLAVRLGPDRVRINVVAPGTVRTRVWDGQGGADVMAPLYPLGRVGEPEDIAAAVAFLASDDGAWVTGVTLPVDGGVLAGPSAALDRLDR